MVKIFPQSPGGTRGIGIIEIVVVVSIVSLISVSISKAIVLTSRFVQQSTIEATAVFLAEEALEAMKVLRNASWDNQIAPLTNGTTYYADISANQWTVTSTNPGAINGLYTRTIVLSAVNRDSNDNISQNGLTDNDTRKLAVTVAWSDHNNPRSITLETYLTNFRAN